MFVYCFICFLPVLYLIHTLPVTLEKVNMMKFTLVGHVSGMYSSKILMKWQPHFSSIKYWQHECNSHRIISSSHWISLILEDNSFLSQQRSASDAWLRSSIWTRTKGSKMEKWQLRRMVGIIITTVISTWKSMFFQNRARFHIPSNVQELEKTKKRSQSTLTRSPVSHTTCTPQWFTISYEA